MIKTLLLLLLITTPVATNAYEVTPEQCQEIAEILEEAVREGYIKEQAAKDIKSRCRKLTN